MTLRMRISGWFLVVVCVGSGVWAAVPADPVERSMYFVEKSTQATELFNAGKAQEAFVIFQELRTCCADLDEDGYVALGLGDCLVELDRAEEARAAYEAAAAAHPELAPRIDSRLAEMDLAGDVSDALIARLRESARGRDESRYTASWRLGRALVVRARDLLTEATGAFETVRKSDAVTAVPRVVSRHIAFLDEMTSELSTMTEGLAEMARFGCGSPIAARRVMEPGREKAATVESLRCEKTISTPQGRRLEIRIRREAGDGDPQIQVNGKPVTLSESQRDLLRRHEERVNAILIEAANEAAKKAGEGK